MRWSKSAWLGTPFVLTNLRWLMVLFYVFPLVFALLWPLVVATLVTIWITTGNGAGLWRGVLFWEVCAITQTWIYAVYRPASRCVSGCGCGCCPRSTRSSGWSFCGPPRTGR